MCSIWVWVCLFLLFVVGLLVWVLGLGLDPLASIYNKKQRMYCIEVPFELFLSVFELI